MHRKGMSTTLTVVVTAIIVLIMALVLITIFSSAITPLATIAQATENCRIQGQATCDTTGSLPVTWGTSTLKDPQSNALTSCQALWEGCNACRCGTNAPGTCIACEGKGTWPAK